ncbi:MAG: isochorismatase family protein [Bacteroidota bacterium]
MITAIDPKSALILIDLQKGILKNETAHPIEQVIMHANLLISSFRKAGLPIVFVTVDPFAMPLRNARVEKPMVAQSKLFRGVQKLGARITGFKKLHPDLRSEPGDLYLTKHTWNAFFETDLHSELLGFGTTNIVLGGISTSVGVEGTARAASELGYNLTFPIDAMTDQVGPSHDNSVKNIFPKLGETGIAADVVRLLPRNSA